MKFIKFMQAVLTGLGALATYNNAHAFVANSPIYFKNETKYTIDIDYALREKDKFIDPKKLGFPSYGKEPLKVSAKPGFSHELFSISSKIKNGRTLTFQTYLKIPASKEGPELIVYLFQRATGAEVGIDDDVYSTMRQSGHALKKWYNIGSGPLPSLKISRGKETFTIVSYVKRELSLIARFELYYIIKQD